MNQIKFTQQLLAQTPKFHQTSRHALSFLLCIHLMYFLERMYRKYKYGIVVVKNSRTVIWAGQVYCV